MKQSIQTKFAGETNPPAGRHQPRRDAPSPQQRNLPPNRRGCQRSTEPGD
jgi:hypothetical protein